ncbi:MAG: hypothetical protein AMJ59_18265 [Gammaproteobacteria bacterium SG8_31]|jgi:putative endonuclease|nr:MAG: hypothetical protein AMJ59_18265 [Gammaproteobacteria bacterium SG8_31]
MTQRAAHIATGQRAEEWAHQFLTQQGLELVTRNFRCRRGEIDLIMRHGQHLVFVEVRYRKTSRYGSAAETVDSRKRARLIRCAEYFLTCFPSLARFPARFDVVTLAPDASGAVSFDTGWIPNAFDAA